MQSIFITGGTGYIGSRLIKKLLERGHKVHALVRSGSEHKLPAGVVPVVANPFDANSFQQSIPKNAVFIQLVGVAHPSPKKKKLFRSIDLASAKASADAAQFAEVSHFIYLSVSMSPTQIMKDYQDARREGEEYCQSKKLNCSFVRPWYVLGPGHWWPVLLLPFYGIGQLVPQWRNALKGKGLVTIGQMINTLMAVVEAKPLPERIIDIVQIRTGGKEI